MLATRPLLETIDFPALTRRLVGTLQVNLGYRCNQQCLHCHVDAGPRRQEVMGEETVAQIVSFLASNTISLLDLTGGAPELNPRFRDLVRAARGMGIRVIDRCNLTVLEEPGQEEMAGFLAEQGVEVVASLPCYLEENVDGQRGAGTFAGSIRALQRLNALGYGSDPRLPLSLVYNPQGASLPAPQATLEADYRRQLGERYGIAFNRLITIANMPIRRFGSMLLSRGEFENYLQLLQEAHRPCNLESVMCRTLLSIDWRGFVYDCDFNQMLDLPVEDEQGPLHIGRLSAQELVGRPIAVAGHCYGCTAGQGSSCGGALSG